MTKQQDVVPAVELEDEGRGLAAFRDELLLRSMARSMAHIQKGRLRLRLPSGRSGTFGNPDGADARLDVVRLSAVWRALRDGALGVAQSYIDGDIETPDLAEVLRLVVDNQTSLANGNKGFFRARLKDKLRHRMRRNSKSGSRRNIAAHYDLGNAFYQLWLDPSMTYSSGIYREPATTLEAAQEIKYRLILDALELEAGHELLEIGCGWGGMAARAAERGARVNAITISAEQHDYAKQALQSAGLGDRGAIKFQDYRDTTGAYDRLVSVEMIEAVGEDHWPTYFSMLEQRLKPGGVAVLQAITIDEPYFEDYRCRPDFIQRYIFPGGMLPTVSGMESLAAAVGLSFETIERFGSSYSRTLAEWRQRFRTAWPQISTLGFDERFRRMWELYLTYCEVGFETGCIDVGVYRLRKAAA